MKVLIADDSATARQLMVHLINHSADMVVVGQAHNGQQAVRLTHELHPDVILMDIVMPGMDGLAAAREIMCAQPTPIVMVSAGLNKQETNVAFQAIRTGALTVLQKPVGPGHPDYAVQSVSLVNSVRAMAGVKVIHHRKSDAAAYRPDIEAPVFIEREPPEITAIAASTGGPAALSEIFSGLPPDFPLPVVVVQHISSDFLPSLVEWLGKTASLTVKIAEAGEEPVPAHIYFAPGDAHLEVARNRRFRLDRTPGKASYMPSSDILLESVAASFGPRAVGVVLTGMGSDGARGLRAMRDVGAYTIAQDEATSVVFGMPQEAFLSGAACDVLPIKAVAPTLASLGARNRKEQTHE
ncbi:MAG: chemotaxis-specific protein-glutamate methyltransferase CheB [Anaerolineae bacterium]|nr:chemotaxis-specific protein-glutamate methyltransferase CheB [Anaerolineae bacterium]